MITQGDAQRIAACAALEIVTRIKIDPADHATIEDCRMVAEEFRKIERWLRCRALGGDKVAIRQVEKELGNQVKMRGKAR